VSLHERSSRAGARAFRADALGLSGTALTLSAADPFADEGEAVEEDDESGLKGKNYVHVRVQQRNGRKSLTTVQVRRAPAGGSPGEAPALSDTRHCARCVRTNTLHA
jgi:hypothetical protein